MPEPQMEMVSSSNVESIGYDESERELWVRFLSGSTYVYIDVDSTTYHELQTAPSVGSFINRAIKNRFNFRKED
jgi:KTSC domain